MELRQLETFRVVMTTLNMTSAAKELYLSPSAVSVQIKRLSDELGTELFTTMGRKLVPTSAAKKLEQHLLRLLEVLRAIHEDFPREIEHDTRPFVLASGSTHLIYRLPDALKELRENFPKNDIQVSTGTTQAIVNGLEQKQVDLGIVSLPLEAPTIQLVPLFKEALLFVQGYTTRTRARKPHRTSIVPKDLRTIPMILYSAGTTERTIVDRMAESHGISLRVIMEVDCTESIKKLVEAGYGASILPETALRGCPRLRKLVIEEAHPFRELALATARTAYPRKLTAVIAEYLCDKLCNLRIQ